LTATAGDAGARTAADDRTTIGSAAARLGTDSRRSDVCAKADATLFAKAAERGAGPEARGADAGTEVDAVTAAGAKAGAAAGERAVAGAGANIVGRDDLRIAGACGADDVDTVVGDAASAGAAAVDETAAAAGSAGGTLDGGTATRATGTTKAAGGAGGGAPEAFSAIGKAGPEADVGMRAVTDTCPFAGAGTDTDGDVDIDVEVGLGIGPMGVAGIRVAVNDDGAAAIAGVRDDNSPGVDAGNTAAIGN
jgi:hypothetical protein